MKKIVVFLLASLAIACQTIAQEKQVEHLLDGTSMDYYYQDGSAVHAEFFDGKFKYIWIAGPNKDMEGTEEYRSRKIGDKMYLVNFMNEASSTFVTFVFDFSQNVMYNSALIFPRTSQEMITFEAGTIERLRLTEK